jgi:hypothetical protein
VVGHTSWHNGTTSAETCKNHLSSVALTTEFQTASGSNISTKTVRRDLHEMVFHGWAAARTSLRSPCAMPSVGWSSGNTFSGVINHASPSGSPKDESGFGGCQENATCPNA